MDAKLAYGWLNPDVAAQAVALQLGNFLLLDLHRPGQQVRRSCIGSAGLVRFADHIDPRHDFTVLLHMGYWNRIDAAAVNQCRFAFGC